MATFQKLALFIVICFSWSFELNAAIYGKDDRRDIDHFGSDIKEAALAVAVSLPSFYLVPDEKEGFLRHEEYKERKYGREVGLCKSQRFYNQTSFGHCTSFLIEENIVISAGHCFLPTGNVEKSAHAYCENFSFWFGYNTHHNRRFGRRIKPENVVNCKKVIYAQNNQMSKDPIYDFAIFELERPMTHIKPLKVSKDIDVGDWVFALGHPHGLPLKHSGRSRVIDSEETYFTAALDTLGGNSGGPVLNRNLEVVGVLTAGHQHDVYSVGSCDKINVCDTKAKRCKEPSQLYPFNQMVKSEVWLPYVEDYLKN